MTIATQHGVPVSKALTATGHERYMDLEHVPTVRLIAELHDRAMTGRL
ncbi:hypothetical protein [Agromyces sp. SYSU T00194]